MAELLPELSWPAIFLLLPLLFLLLRAFSGERRLHLPPSPAKLPIIGNLHQIGSPPHRSLAALAGKHGPLMLLRMGHVRTLVVSSAEMAREITRAHDGVFCDRPPLKAPRILMYGATDPGFARYGDYWRQTKKLIVLHLLSGKKVQSLNSVREEEVALLTEKIAAASAKETAAAEGVNMSEMLSSFITDLICRVVSGKRLRRDGRNEVVRELVKEAGVAFMGFFFEDFFPAMGWLDEVFRLTRRAKRNSKRWDAFLDELIDEHLPDRANMDGVEEDKDFLHSILADIQEQQDKVAITRENIKAILMDLFTAGTDTTSVTIEWVLAELIRNPKMMKKAQSEVRERSSGGMIRSEELDKMIYLKAVIKEAMRLHPTGPLLLPRESMEDCHVGGFFIPKNTRVFVNAWAIGRDPDFWDKPEEFDPERFLIDSAPVVDLKGNDFQLIPFGAGRRICTGLAFAMASVELSLANLLQQFDWELPPCRKDIDMDEGAGFTMRRKVPLRLAPTPRNYRSLS